jgi:hypothetical protein
MATRYYRWRTAITRPIWILDRHWYGLVGWLYVMGAEGISS